MPKAIRRKCSTCKFWWLNTEQGVVEEANRRKRHKCLRGPYDSDPRVGGKTGACRNYKKVKPFYMVPWDGKTFIRVDADSKKEMLQKVSEIVHETAEPIIQSILLDEGIPFT